MIPRCASDLLAICGSKCFSGVVKGLCQPVYASSLIQPHHHFGMGLWDRVWALADLKHFGKEAVWGGSGKSVFRHVIYKMIADYWT